MNQHKVFISFSSKDSTLALKIYERLNRRGIKSWISAKDISPGADYQSAIVAAIEEAEIVVLVFSSQAAGSNEIAKELSLASKKMVIPARIEDIEPKDAFKYQLSNRQFIDLFDDFDRNLDDLVDKVIGILPADTVYTKKRDQGMIFLGKVNRLIFYYGKKLVVPITLILIISGVIYSIDWQKQYDSNLSKLSNWTDSIHIPLPWSTVKDRLLADIGEMTEDSKFNDSDKLKLMKKVLPEIETLLSAEEANKLLNTLNDSNRGDGIKNLGEALAPNINGEGVALILKGTSGVSRREAINYLKKAEKIKMDLTAKEAEMILKGIAAGHPEKKKVAINIISSQLSAGLNGQDLALILKGLEGSNRRYAIGYLKKKDKIKMNLSASEAEVVLKGISSGYPEKREEAIKIIASQLVNLKTDDLPLIFGDMDGNEKKKVIKYLKKLGKIKV